MDFLHDPAGNRYSIQDLAGNLSNYTYGAIDRLTQDSTSVLNACFYASRLAIPAIEGFNRLKPKEYK